MCLLIECNNPEFVDRVFHMVIPRVLFVILVAWSVPVLGQTQLEMNTNACAEYKRADEKLNAVYQQVLREHKDDPLLAAKLKEAQRAWLKFRDAELAAIFPASNEQTEYGSVYPMCNCMELTVLVNQRIEQLSGWLSAEEGDVCRGSR
ncbi:MAG: lysozyme inhibitor LprI family protein [Gammaproteobacteria bacterium]